VQRGEVGQVKPNHAAMVKAAGTWLRRQQRCAIVATELVAAGSMETPDAIGWRFSGSQCVVVECKVSRGDFLRDGTKCAERAGNLRYYLTTPALVRRDEVPPKWGLLELHGREVRLVAEAEWAEGCPRNERGIMYSLLLRQSRGNSANRTTIEICEA
jgi:hypothetical protein